jgi:hypothetical protein
MVRSGTRHAPTLYSLFPVSVTSVVNILLLPRYSHPRCCTTEFTEFTEEGWGWLGAGHDTLLPSIFFFLSL